MRRGDDKTMAKLVVKNVAYGHTIGTGQSRRFFPHRSSSDYDPTYLAGPEGVRAREKVKAKKKKVTTKKAKAKKATKKAKKNPSRVGVPVGKFMPARLNANGTVSFMIEGKPKRKAAKKKAKKVAKRKK